MIADPNHLNRQASNERLLAILRGTDTHRISGIEALNTANASGSASEYCLSVPFDMF